MMSALDVINAGLAIGYSAIASGLTVACLSLAIEGRVTVWQPVAAMVFLTAAMAWVIM